MPEKIIPKCPRCGSIMHRLYLRTRDENGKRHFDPDSWRCSNMQCRYFDGSE